jgi:PKHD-type hydroxylase
MLHIIATVLDQAGLARVRDLLEGAPWQDGRATAGAQAAAVKANMQVPPGSAQGRAVAQEARAALLAHDVVQAAAWPRRIGPVLASRTEAGGGYGAHVDEPLMAHAGARLRTDLAFTLFLSDPASYAGGALLIDTSFGRQSVTLPAGHIVLYPAGFVHAVEPVTAGTRLVLAGWIESHVPDVAQRDALFTLETARATASGEQALTLARLSGLLVRMWARP